MRALDRRHAWAVRQPALHLLALLSRVLLALAFLPSGLVKIRGEPFTMLPVTDPVGYFFAGFFSAPGYYGFVGVMQWLAGALLLIPRTATLGALAYLPIALNIFVITVAVHFGGTGVVTGGMVLANVWLLFWDWDRMRGVVGGAVAWRDAADVRARHGEALTTIGMFIGATVGFFGVTAAHLGRLRGGVPVRAWAMIAVGAVLGGAMLARALGRSSSEARPVIRTPRANG